MIPEPVVPLSALEHHVYCPRQCALIHVDGIWDDNEHTVAGRRAHRRVDSAPGRWERGRLVLRALPLYSDRYGLSGRADVVEIDTDGTTYPVEYKAGVRHGRAAEVQLCAQALCLEDMTGRKVPAGFIWYGSPRRRYRIGMTDELRLMTLKLVDEIRLNLGTGHLPPAVADQRCRECQLEPICMPDVVIHPAALDRYLQREVMRCE